MCNPSKMGSLSGWWFSHPSEKYESQLGWWHSQYFWENKIHGNQTTNQLLLGRDCPSSFCPHSQEPPKNPRPPRYAIVLPHRNLECGLESFAAPGKSRCFFCTTRDWSDFKTGLPNRQIEPLLGFVFFLGSTSYAPDLWNQKLLG